MLGDSSRFLCCSRIETLFKICGTICHLARRKTRAIPYVQRDFRAKRGGKFAKSQKMGVERQR
jgi:hypothetical protein